MTSLSARWVWIDLEMTGLDISKERIIEVACIITDGELNVIEEGPCMVIHQDAKIMNAMGDWCTQQHHASGLTEKVRLSKISETEAEQQLLQFIQKHTIRKDCYLAGNSVHVDKEFLKVYMPTIIDHLHHRIVDVSTVKVLCSTWYPQLYQSMPSKAGQHRALDDIRESIAELQWYRRHLFISPT